MFDIISVLIFVDFNQCATAKCWYIH